jgi:serine/threonine-protein kinase HipA
MQAGIYFKGLLPEGQHLQTIASEANLTTSDTFGLLERYGRDVAGALVISATDPGERVGDVEPYTDAGLEEEVASLPERPLGIHDDSELSLAGLQDKLLLVDLGEGRWGRPIHGRPSTHILKVEDRRYPGMAALEVSCLQLARSVGLTTIDAVTTMVADIPCLIVSRFDRRFVDGRLERIHQEDACQALARDPDVDRGKGKYESNGGPELREIAQLLDLYAENAPREMERLLGVATFTVLTGNADAHGKNIALLHPSPGTVELAPLYDTVPTMLWPKLRKRAAMSIGRRVNLDAIRLTDLVTEARAWPLARDQAERVVEATVQAVVGALGKGNFPDQLKELVAVQARHIIDG